jgi:hypothetical protein
MFRHFAITINAEVTINEITNRKEQNAQPAPPPDPPPSAGEPDPARPVAQWPVYVYWYSNGQVATDRQQDGGVMFANGVTSDDLRKFSYEPTSDNSDPQFSGWWYRTGKNKPTDPPAAAGKSDRAPLVSYSKTWPDLIWRDEEGGIHHGNNDSLIAEYASEEDLHAADYRHGSTHIGPAPDGTSIVVKQYFARTG